MAFREPTLGIAALVVASVGAVMLSMTPIVGADHIPGLLASEQRLLGRANTLTEVVLANPAQLGADQRRPITWWAPGQQQIVHTVRKSGLSLGQSIKVVVLSSWLIGIIGWSSCMWLALDDKRIAPWLISAFALFRLSHTSGFTYAGGETILWGVFPIIALLNRFALQRTGRLGVVSALSAFGSGALAASLIVLKYSGALLGLGFGVAWLWSYLARDVDGTRLLGWIGGAACGLALASHADVFDLMQGATPVSTHLPHPLGVVIAWGIFGPLSAVADVGEAATSAARQLGYDTLPEALVGLVALALGVTFVCWVVSSRRSSDEAAMSLSPGRQPAWRIGVSITVVVSTALVVLLLRGADINWDVRYHQYGAFLLMPFFAERLLTTIRARDAALRRMSLTCLMVFFLLPTLYGTCLLAKNALVHTFAQRKILGPTDIHLAWSREGAGATAVLRELSETPAFHASLLATISWRTALSFPEHRILLLQHPADAASQHFQGNPAGGVAVLVPPGVNESHTRLLLDAFDDIDQWTERRLASAPAAQLWVSR